MQHVGLSALSIITKSTRLTFWMPRFSPCTGQLSNSQHFPNISLSTEINSKNTNKFRMTASSKATVNFYQLQQHQSWQKHFVTTLWTNSTNSSLCTTGFQTKAIRPKNTNWQFKNTDWQIFTELHSIIKCHSNFRWNYKFVYFYL